MSSILTRKYRQIIAQSFLDAITNETSHAFVTLGKVDEWTDSANASVNDSAPPAPTDTIQSTDFDFWRDAIVAKQVGAANVAFVISRRDWANNTLYAQYDDTNASLFDEEFYVLDVTTDPKRVYKCLWNNDGANSTVAPSTIGAATSPTETLDGYVWQYMYTIDVDYEKFLTDDWMPVVEDANVVTNAETYPGKLPTAVPLIIEDGGASYNATATITTTITGDGANAAVSSNGVSVTAGVVTSVRLSDGGTGYTQVTSVNVYQSGASAASARVIIPPYPNHGADPIKELGSVKLMAVVQFSNDESGFLTVNNNIRRVGLLINPLDANSTLANDSVYSLTYDLTLSSNTGVLSADDVVINTTKTGNPSGIVVDVISANSNYVVRLTSVNPVGYDSPFEADDVIRCNTSGVEATVSSVTEPGLKKYSGSFVYINQRTPVTRGSGQTEDFKFIIPF